MSTHTSIALSQLTNVSKPSVFLTLSATAFLVLCAQVEIPLHPIPMNLQTFSLFLLALFQSPRRAFSATVLYLFLGTCGLPVFSGAHSNPFWMLTPRVGYLIAFPIATYIISVLYRGLPFPSSLLRASLSVLAGQFAIYTLGLLGLTCFCSPSVAVQVGLLPFLPLAFLKLLSAVSIRKAFS